MFYLNKGQCNTEKATKIMTTEIDVHVKDGYSLQYDVHLNRFMVHWDITQFLTDFAGVPSWDDMSEDDEMKCFRDYPKKSLPVWDEMVQES